MRGHQTALSELLSAAAWAAQERGDPMISWFHRLHTNKGVELCKADFVQLTTAFSKAGHVAIYEPPTDTSQMDRDKLEQALAGHALAQWGKGQTSADAISEKLVRAHKQITHRFDFVGC